jgi:hypothetical protein
MRRFVAMAVAMAMLVGGVAMADTHTWIGGGGDDNWSNPLNWQDGAAANTVPVDGDDVIISSTVTIDVDTDTALLNDFTVNNQRPTINGPAKLTVNGDLDVSSNGVPEWGQYTRINAQLSGTGKVNLLKGGLALSNTANDYSGGTDLVDPGYRQFMYTANLGSGDVAITASDPSTNNKNFIVNNTDQSNLPKVTVTGAGASFNNHDDILGGGPIVLDGGWFGGESDPGDSWTCAVDIQVAGPNSGIGGAGRTTWYTATYTGDITGTETLTYSPRNQNPENHRSRFQHANTSFSGDWVIALGYAEVDAVQGLGTGDFYVKGDAIRAHLILDVAGALDSGSTVYLLAGGTALLDVNADNTIAALSYGGTLGVGGVEGYSWALAGVYDGSVADPMDLTAWIAFDGTHELTILGPIPPVAEPAGLGLLGLALLGLRKRRS